MSFSGKSKHIGTLQTTDLMCKNDCGFFGNPEWQGYCSKCYRELNQKSLLRKKPSKKVQRSYSDVQDSTLSLGFSKFEEKKKQQTEKRANTLKTIIKRGHTLKESNSQSPSKDVFPAGDSLSKDLQIKDSVIKDVSKFMKQQMDVMQKYYDKSIDEQAEAMHDYYNFMFNRAETHNAYKDMSPEQIDLLLDKIEEQLMSHMHRNITHQITSEYEEKDLALQKRIRNLNWITPQHLGLDIKENSPEVRDLIDKAITDVIEMDAKIAPQEKISCIVKCSKSIFSLINLQGITASADEFLPTMVYIVLKANPPLLQSNIKYITSFSLPPRLRSGEGAYFFTNLCCAVEFIDQLTAESLNISEDEFNRYMSGEMPLTNFEPDVTASEGLRLMTQNFNSLSAIQDKTNQVMEDLLVLKNDLNNFEETIRKCKSTPPLIINPTPYTVPSNVDMSLIPEVLRSRVVRAPLEAVLVDIDSQSELFHSSMPEEATSLVDTSEPKETDKTPDSSLNNDTKLAFSPAVDLSTFIQPLQVVLPSATIETSSLSSHSLISNVPQFVNIQDVEYPTDVFPENKPEDSVVEFGPFESCDTAEADDNVDIHMSTVDPMSPNSSFMEQNWQLPPPLQPVVVRNVSVESNDKKV
ncbi:rab5 GDP/GTP exchange factor [Parasteatoda tepidariorum]|uniref:rab5 GDP/GTP exchange factor n=1 Tax=Parasteatoda tepidariorum TaxID=114398 RepID=UPI00077F892D